MIVRESRSVGLPEGLPDIHGLAIRVTNPDGTLVTCCSRRPVGPADPLRADRQPHDVRTPDDDAAPLPDHAGPVLLGARSAHSGVVQLACAVGGGPWRGFAELSISREDAPDPTISFDPVVNQVAGLDHYPAVIRLREPAYRSARRSRDDS